MIFNQLTGGNTLQPHALVLEAISKSHFGFIYYPSSPHTQNSIPTKLYEYLGCRLPILLQNYKPWMDMTNPYRASINIDFSNPAVSSILETMKNFNFYTTAPTHTNWESEEPKLLNA